MTALGDVAPGDVNIALMANTCSFQFDWAPQSHRAFPINETQPPAVLVRPVTA